MKYKHPQETANFFKAVMLLKDEEECEKFFNDVLTFQELESIAQRLEVASLLLAGHNYSEINKNTGASTATISRVGRSLNYGEGGYKAVLQKMGVKDVESKFTAQ